MTSVPTSPQAVAAPDATTEADDQRDQDGRGGADVSGMVALQCPECRARSYHEAARVAFARDDTGAWAAVARSRKLHTDNKVECTLCRDPALEYAFPLIPLHGKPGDLDPVIEVCAACAARVLVTGHDHMGALCAECTPAAGSSTPESLPEICAQWYVEPLRGPTATVEVQMGTYRLRVRYPLRPDEETRRECLWQEDTDNAVCGRPMRFVRAVALHERWALSCPDCIAGRRIPWPPVGPLEPATLILRCFECGAESCEEAAPLAFEYQSDSHFAAYRNDTDERLLCDRCGGQRGLDSVQR